MRSVRKTLAHLKHVVSLDGRANLPSVNANTQVHPHQASTGSTLGQPDGDLQQTLIARPTGERHMLVVGGDVNLCRGAAQERVTGLGGLLERFVNGR